MEGKNTIAPILTICSAYHSDMTRQILEMNWDLVNKLNPNSSWLWLAADNSPKECAGKRLNSAKFTVIPGGTVPDYVPKPTWSGYHFGAALNNLLKHAQTRFVLLLDYDFFIVRPNWIKEVLGYMQQKRVGLLGVPYHPKFFPKFRYFPSHHSLFIDRQRVDTKDWDFKPQYSLQELKKFESYAEEHQNARKKDAQKKINVGVGAPRHPQTLRHWLRLFLKGNIMKRFWIGSSKDTAYDLYRRYYKKNIVRYECFQPTLDLYRDIVRRHYYLHPRWTRLVVWIEKLFPDRWSYIPKKKGYFTLTRFKDLGYFDALGEGLEEYFWQGSPWGFHLRGFWQRDNEFSDKFDPEGKIKITRRVIESFEKYYQL